MGQCISRQAVLECNSHNKSRLHESQKRPASSQQQEDDKLQCSSFKEGRQKLEQKSNGERENNPNFPNRKCLSMIGQNTSSVDVRKTTEKISEKELYDVNDNVKKGPSQFNDTIELLSPSLVTGHRHIVPPNKTSSYNDEIGNFANDKRNVTSRPLSTDVHDVDCDSLSTSILHPLLSKSISQSSVTTETVEFNNNSDTSFDMSDIVESVEYRSRERSYHRRLRTNSSKASKGGHKVIQDPDSSILTDCNNMIPASFTPIKQTSLQTKVSVIREDEDFDAPTDEEDFHGRNNIINNQKNIIAKGRVSGPLTPVKLRTQWKSTPSSIVLREPTPWQNKSTSVTTSPLRTERAPLDKESPNNSSTALEDGLLNNFQKLKLQVAVAEQQGKRNQKVAKIEDRIKDVQGYKELWGEFQEIQKKVQKDDDLNTEHDNIAQTTQASHPTVDVVEYDLEDDTAILLGRRRKSHSKSRRNERSPDKSINHQRTSLNDPSVWIFDFRAEGFEVAGNNQQDDEKSQSSLSLLSEKSLEAQRRLFAQKRKESKQKKKKQKNSTINIGMSNNLLGTPAMRQSPTKMVLNDNVSASSSHGDYGPIHRLRRPLSIDVSANDGCSESIFPVITDMEVAFRTIDVHKRVRGFSDTDSCSMVSDLADDLSLSASVGSHISKDNVSVCSGSNDYRVNRRRHHKYSHRSVDLERYVPSSSSVGSSIASIAERRKAIEARLQLLSKKESEVNSAVAATPLQLKNRFDAVVTPSPPQKELGTLPLTTSMNVVVVSQDEASLKHQGESSSCVNSSVVSAISPPAASIESLKKTSNQHPNMICNESSTFLSTSIQIRSLIESTPTSTVDKSIMCMSEQLVKATDSNTLDSNMDEKFESSIPIPSINTDTAQPTSSTSLLHLDNEVLQQIPCVTPIEKGANELHFENDITPNSIIFSNMQPSLVSPDYESPGLLLRKSSPGSFKCQTNTEASNNDPYRRFLPDGSKRSSHRTSSTIIIDNFHEEKKEASLCSLESEKEENHRDLKLTNRTSTVECEARKSLELADKVAVQVQEVLDRFRNTRGSYNKE